MGIEYHNDLIQGSDSWLAARRGLLTASEMKLIITPANLTPAKNDKEKAHMFELLAQRITGYVEPHYVGDDMLRGMVDEVEARILYSKHYAEVTEVGFITNDKWGFKLGYSPDGLVGNDGLIECKSRRQKFQVETILNDEVPSEYFIQIQTGLLVSERQWIDFITYSAGLPMKVIRVYPDKRTQDAIIEAAALFEGRLTEKMKIYNDRLAAMGGKLITTERKIEEEITV